MTGLDICIVCTFLGLILFIGFHVGQKIKTFNDYAIGNRNFSNFALMCTAAATMIGGSSTIGLIGQVHKIGVTQILAHLGSPLAYLMVALFCTAGIRKFYGCLSIGDILYKSYGMPGKVFGGLIVCIYEAFNVSVQFMAIGILVSALTGISYNLSLFLSAGIIFLYTGRGGIRAVTFTDVLQFMAFMVGIPLLVIVALYKIGGFSNLIQSLPESHLTITEANLHRYLMLMLVYALPGLPPPTMQRLLMSKDRLQGLQSYSISSLIYLLLVLLSLVVGLCSYVLYPHLTMSDKALPILMHDCLPMGIYGFVMVAFLAVLMSTSDSLLNVASVSFVNDLILPFCKNPVSERRKLKIAWGFSLLLVLSAISLALNKTGIFEVKVFVRSLYFPIIVIPLYWSFANRKISRRGFFVSIFFGFITTSLWNVYLKPTTHIDGILPGFIANLISFTLFYLFGRGKGVIFQPTDLLKMQVDKPKVEQTPLNINENTFRTTTNIGLGLFLICIQIIPMFFNNGITNTKITWAFINSFVALLLIFGSAQPFPYFELLKNVALFLCLPLSSMYFMFTDAACSGLHFLILIMSLILIFILSEEQHHKGLPILAACLILGSSLALARNGLNFELPKHLYWVYGLYLISFILVICIVYFRLRIFTLTRDNSRMLERYNLARQISHDMMTPLAVLSILLKKGEAKNLSEKEKKILWDSMEEMGNIADSIVPGISQSYRQLPLENLKEIMERCIEQKRFLRKNLPIQLEVIEAVEARVDASNFFRIAGLILNNCLASLADPQKGNVLISIGKDKFGNSQIIWSDDHQGFSDFKLNKVFNEETAGVLGIGLQEMSKLIETWHGRLQFDSAQNGSLVVLSFPPKNCAYLLENGDSLPMPGSPNFIPNEDVEEELEEEENA